jgi:hypothetical protein
MTQGFSSPIRFPTCTFCNDGLDKALEARLPSLCELIFAFIAFKDGNLVTLSLNETPHDSIKILVVMTAPSWMYFVILDSCAGETRIRSV